MEIRGVAPWFTIEAAPEELVVIAHLPIPSAKEVDKCINCPWAECRDCIRKRKDSFKEPHRPPVYDVTVIRRLVDEGNDEKQISSTVGCSKSTARRYIRKFTTSA